MDSACDSLANGQRDGKAVGCEWMKKIVVNIVWERIGIGIVVLLDRRDWRYMTGDRGCLMGKV